jgi:hypothetical protein
MVRSQASRHGMLGASLGVIVVLAMLATACTQGSPTATPSSSASPGGSGGSSSPGTGGSVTGPPTDPQIPPGPDGGTGNFDGMVVTRSGGIAGIMQQLVIAPDGGWVYTDERSGSTEQGTLTTAQRSQLIGLLTNPALAAEATKAGTGGCADAFNYTVALVNMTFDYDQCGDPSQRPLTEQLLTLLTGATAL